MIEDGKTNTLSISYKHIVQTYVVFRNNIVLIQSMIPVIWTKKSLQKTFKEEFQVLFYWLNTYLRY